MSNKATRGDAGKPSRRAFLQQTSAMAGLVLVEGIGVPAVAKAADATVAAPAAAVSNAAVASTVPPADVFLATSQFLTGHALDKETGARFFDALSKNDPQFGDKLAHLSDAIKQANVPTMDAFLALPGKDPALAASATEIVSAWYLGVVGKGDNAVLISFYDALMFEATRNYTYVPSYGGGPNSWVATPPFKTV
jgi:hypothetical protein